MQAPLAPPTPEAVALIAAENTDVVEVGAGDGYWIESLRAAGVAVTAFDLEPRGPDVKMGDHLAAAEQASPHAMLLAVWPPDGPEIARWVAARRWSSVGVCADFSRCKPQGALDDHFLVDAVRLPAGPKGSSDLRIYRRSAP